MCGDLLFKLILSHLLFDYGKALTPEMIAAKSKGYPYIPIAKHALLHSIGVFTVLILYDYSIQKSILLSLFEFTTHFIIDVSKGRIETKYPKLKDDTNPYKWHLFQIDQLLHITSKYIISII